MDCAKAILGVQSSMDVPNTRFPFYTTLLEWYEFTIYNLLIPYGIFGGSGESLLYIGFIIFALSFAARPIGAIYFSGFSDRTKALKKSLLLMVISTTLMALAPTNLGVLTVLWFTLCKFAQGISIGGSYGLSYLSVYDREEMRQEKRTNYKLAIVQIGWVLGILLGQVTVFLVKLFIGNSRVIMNLLLDSEFIKILHINASPSFVLWGWRIPFLLSSTVSVILYLVVRQKQSELVTKRKNILLQIIQFIKNNKTKFIAILAIASIDMVISHLWFTYGDIAKENGKVQILRYVVLLFIIPFIGRVVDKLNSILGDLNGNYFILFLVCVSMAFFGLYAPWSGQFWGAISTLYAGIYFGGMPSLVIAAFPKMDRQMMTPITLNITSALVGGTIPILATIVSKQFGDFYIGLMMTISSIFAAIGLMYIRFT